MLKYIYLIIISFSFLFMTSCKNEDISVEVQKVDISNNLLFEKCYLELDIITNTKLSEVDISFDNVNYTYVKNQNLKKDNHQYYYLHRYYISFGKEEVLLDKVNVEYLNIKETHDLGKYDCNIYENSTNDIKTSTYVTEDQVELYISNETYNEVEILSITALEDISSHSLEISKIPTHKRKIDPKEVEKYSNIKIDFNPNYKQVSKYLKIEVLIDNKKEYIYALYCYDKR